MKTKNAIIIAGPNGAGKTTFAREFLPQEADCPVFIINLYKPLADAWRHYDNAGEEPVLIASSDTP